MKKKIIKFYAYLERNFGDDLMVDMLLQRYSQFDFYYADSWKNSDFFKDHSNFFNPRKLYENIAVRWTNRLCNLLTFGRRKDFFFRWYLSKIEQNSLCAVEIGGSIFMQDEPYYKQLDAENYRCKDGPMFVIGANFGPYTEQGYLLGMKDYFAKCKSVTFREEESYRLFEELPNVQWAPDVVFNLDIPQAAENSGEVLISIINMQRRRDLEKWAADYRAFIVSVCEWAVEEGKTPVLVSFCDTEGDEDEIGRVLQHLSEDTAAKTKTLFYRGDRAEMLRRFAAADTVVATRFHAMILAMCCGKPFFAVAYSKKVSNVLDDLGCDAYCFPDSLGGLTGRQMAKRIKTVDVQQCRTEAQRQFAPLDSFLQNISDQ